MKKNLIVVLMSVLLAACGGMKNLTGSSSANSGASSAATKPAVGDDVVAKKATNWFTEGKIRVIEGQKANIAWSQKNSTNTDVDLANVYVVPKPGARPSVKTDDFVIVKMSASADSVDWVLAQITSVSDSVIAVKDYNDFPYNLSPEKVIAVSPADAADIKANFEKIGKQRDFDKKAQIGRPVAPNGYKPKTGETVVAAASSSSTVWYVGQVKSITGNNATIVFDTKPNSNFETTLDKIVPNMTTAETTTPAVNDYLLIKSPSCANCPLIYTQVTAVNGANIETKDRYDVKFTARPGEFLALK